MNYTTPHSPLPTPHKYGLALHTSSPQLGLALSNFAENSRASTWDLGRDISNRMHQELAEFIQPQKWSDLAFIAVAKGPGGYTGTRIGVVTARTLAQQLNIPLFAISSLAALAWGHHLPTPHTQKTLAVQMLAQRGQIFTALYQTSPAHSGLKELLPDTVMLPQAWHQTLESYSTPYQLIEAPTGLGATVESVLALAYLDWQQGKHPHWSEALPFYGQHPVDY